MLFSHVFNCQDRGNGNRNSMHIIMTKCNRCWYTDFYVYIWLLMIPWLETTSFKRPLYDFLHHFHSHSLDHGHRNHIHIQSAPSPAICCNFGYELDHEPFYNCEPEAIKIKHLFFLFMKTMKQLLTDNFSLYSAHKVGPIKPGISYGTCIYAASGCWTWRIR